VQKKLLMLATTAIVLLASPFAMARPPQPSVCPTVSAISTPGVSRNTIEIDQLWFAGRRHMTYQTGNEWTFVMGNIPAVNANDAFLKASDNLITLFLQAGPFFDYEWNRWVCLYATGAGYPAVAMNPPLVSLDANVKAFVTKY
jgi:hypothetical protein